MLDEARDISVNAAGQVRGWLSTNTDLSMVASAFGLDPLAHTAEDRGVTLWNKTGTNDGVRCDVGVVRRASSSVTYAVLANWSPQGPSDPIRDEVLAAMQQNWPPGTGRSRAASALRAVVQVHRAAGEPVLVDEVQRQSGP